MENRVVSDTGPILHLHEINKQGLLSLFSKIIISQIIQEELSKYRLKINNNITIAKINNDQVAMLSQRYLLELGESSAIWLCKSLNIPLLLTDDLNAGEVAQALEIKPVGTLGIIMRGYREKIISQKEAIELLNKLHKESSLFITSELINYAIKEVKRVELA